MDLVCTRCGEPWHCDYVIHECPNEFGRIGGVIRRCPCCPKATPKHSPGEQERLETIAVLGELLADDIDGFAATLEDFGLLNPRDGKP